MHNGQKNQTPNLVHRAKFGVCLFSGHPSQSVLPGNSPGLVRIDRDMHPQCLLRQYLLDVLRPFHDAEASAVDVVVESDVQSLGRLGDPIEIKMIHRLSAAGAIFIDNREGRRADSVLPHAESPAYRRRERGLAGPHRCIESKNVMPFRLGKEIACGPVDVLQALYSDLVSHILGFMA